MGFSEEYGHIRTQDGNAVREDAAPVRERVVQCVWYDQLFDDKALDMGDGRPLRVLSPGWWNHGEGPDFCGAQLLFGDDLVTGDVEVHLDHSAWRQHRHHLDSRYDEVVLHVVLSKELPKTPVRTSQGRPVPCLLLGQYLDQDLGDLAERLTPSDYPYAGAETGGRCAAFTRVHGADRACELLNLAGEWRMLNKAQALRERMDRTGAEQALYEAVFMACGYSHFKHHFRVIARQLPCERLIQLCCRDPLLAEAALLQMAGLLPRELPEGTCTVPHFTRLSQLRTDHLPQLRSLPLTWKRNGVRPINYPERRLAGTARFFARTAREGLMETIAEIWATDLKPSTRRKAFEELFPKPMGFWATHCSWTSKKLSRPAALLGQGRVRSIIGNVFVPAGIAVARATKDRRLEETVLAFFNNLPKEPDNQVLKVMRPRVFGEVKQPRLTFRTQQGLLQLHQDWCEHNPSCHNCSLAAYIELGQSGVPYSG